MGPDVRRIAILGATGHVARNLIDRLGRDPSLELLLYARRPGAVETFLEGLDRRAACTVMPIDRFPDDACDAVLDCGGIGDPAKVSGAGPGIYEAADPFGALVLDYLEQRPGTRCVAFSSGAVYGAGFSEPAGDDTPATFPVNRLAAQDHYGIAKLAAEARHRAARDLSIVDLRLFAFFSRHMDTGAGYFMTDVVAAIRQGRELVTGPDDMWRDYVHPSDLAALVRCVLDAGPLNDVFDVTSAAPVSKREVLEHFAREFGLKYAVDETLAVRSATGTKAHYYSTSTRTRKIGYRPGFTALEAVTEEARAMLLPDGSGTE